MAVGTDAAVAVVVDMKGNASTEMQKFSGQMKMTKVDALQLQVGVLALGSAFGQMSALLGSLDSPMAKTASRILNIGNYMLTTSVAIATIGPHIKTLIMWLRQLNVTMAITNALSGPKGWIALLGAVGVGAGALALMSRSGGGTQETSRGGITINQNVQGSVITERELGQIAKREIIKDANRNDTSGVR